MFHNICWECTACFGKLNSGRLFYVIRCPKSELGFFGLYNYVVDNLKLAESKNAEPVIDWKYYPNDYILEDKLVGRANAWDYFFLPASGVSLEEVYRSKNVIMSGGAYSGTLSEVRDADESLHSSRLIAKYIVLNERTEDLLDREYKRLAMGKGRVLGVKCRGADFRETRPKNHVICPDVETTVRIISQKCRDGGDKIFWRQKMRLCLSR